jgi:potassium efflux system protein
MSRLPTTVIQLYIHLTGRLILLLLLFGLFAVPVTASNQRESESTKNNSQTTEDKTTPPTIGSENLSITTAPVAIPAADIATKATEVSSLLHTLTDNLKQSAEIDAIMQNFLIAEEQSDLDGQETLTLLKGRPALPTLQAEQRKWQQIQLNFSNWLSTLTNHSKDIQDSLTRLAELKTTWSLTLATAEEANIPDTSLQQVNATLTAMQHAEVPMEAELGKVLDSQSLVGSAVAKSGTILARITQIQEASMSGTLVQDSLPIWDKEIWIGLSNSFSNNIDRAMVAYKSGFDNYFRAPLNRMLLNGGVLILLAILFLAIRNKVSVMSAEGQLFPPAIKVFDHPLAAALTIILIVTTSPVWSQMPATIRDTFQLLAFIPMILLVRPVVYPLVVSCLCALGILFALDTTREVFSDQQSLDQFLLTVESFFGVIVTFWFLRKGKAALSKTYQVRCIQIVASLVMCALAAGFVTAGMGYVRLSLLITPGIIAAGVLAFALYASLQVALGLIAISFKVWPLRTLGMIQHHRPMLERRIHRVLFLAAFGGLTIRYLSYLGLLEPVLEFGKALLETKIERGVINVSPGDILEFIVTVCAAYLLSALIRFILREDVYPRVKIPLGNSYALSSLLHYVIVALGFTAAIAAIGVDLTKLSVLTGAFGIGLGFGLQGVVNNFVSGLILLFERPIHVGDMVEVGDTVGNVRRIGIRASTVQTIRGSDIIIPNSKMVAENVTNWTLSDRLRRIELPVGVSYSSKPEDVIKLLEDVALNNPEVMRSPAPQGLMVGYGDSSLDFELRVWTDQFENWVKIRSELSVAIYHAVASAGMTFPFPQREVRLLKDFEKEVPRCQSVSPGDETD